MLFLVVWPFYRSHLHHVLPGSDDLGLEAGEAEEGPGHVERDLELRLQSGQVQLQVTRLILEWNIWLNDWKLIDR